MALSDSYVSKKDDWSKEQVEEFVREEEKAAYLHEAGLEGADITKLKDTLLSPSEAVAMKTEQVRNAAERRGGKKTDWEEWVDAKRRLGRVLEATEVIRRLRTIIPTLEVLPGRVRHTFSLFRLVRKDFQIPDPHSPTGYVLETKEGYEFLGWISDGEVPEYEIDLVNEIKVPVGQKRGWRTLLLRLICRYDELGRASSVITEDQALQAFGHPTQGATASHYRSALYRFRNGLDRHASHATQ